MTETNTTMSLVPSRAEDADSSARWALRTRDVFKTFPGVAALSDVNLAVRAGQVHGVVGENGAGKSTLMSIVAGSTLPDSGSVEIAGTMLSPITPERARELGVAIVRQEPALMPDLSVAENLFLGVGPGHRPSPSGMVSWAREHLEDWKPGAGSLANRRVELLSPEQRFIVEICKGLLQKPQVLVLDEPTEHLAAEDVDRLFARMQTIVAHGGSVVYISHRVAEVRQVADEITVLRDGRTVGTFGVEALSESDIINLIVGRELEATFPDKQHVDRTGAPRLALSQVEGPGFGPCSLELYPREVVGLAGIEGHGQRDLARALAGLSRISGTSTLDGSPVRIRGVRSAAKAGIAYLPRDRHRESLMPGLNVGEHVVFRGLAAVSSAGIVRNAREASYVANAVQGLRIKAPSMATDMTQLSGGNQQKGVLAGVMATRPKVLIADAPTQGVDVGARSEIYRLLRERALQEDASVILLSSDAAEVAGLCDRVLVFSRGEIVAELVDDEVTESAITSAALTATSSRRQRANKASKALDWLAGDGAPLWLVMLAVLLLGGYGAQVDSRFVSGVNLNSMLALATPLALVALGQLMVMLVGGIDLSVGPLIGFVIVVESFYLVDGALIGTQAVGWILFFAIPIAVGLVNWSLTEYFKLHPMVATLAMYMALQALSLVLRPTPDGVISPQITDILSKSVGPVPCIFIAAVALGLALQFLLRRTRFGIELRATGSDDERARAAGIRVAAVRAGAYVGCSLLSGLAALALLAQIGMGDATAGTSYTLVSVSVVVVAGTSIFGGRGSFAAVLAAALLFTELSSVTTFLGLEIAWQSYLIGGVSLVAVSAFSISRQIVRRSEVV